MKLKGTNWKRRVAKERAWLERQQQMLQEPSDLGYAAARFVQEDDRADLEAMLRNEVSKWIRMPSGTVRGVDPVDIFEWFCKRGIVPTVPVSSVYAFVCGVYLALLHGEICGRAGEMAQSGLLMVPYPASEVATMGTACDPKHPHYEVQFHENVRKRCPNWFGPDGLLKPTGENTP